MIPFMQHAGTFLCSDLQMFGRTKDTRGMEINNCCTCTEAEEEFSKASVFTCYSLQIRSLQMY